MNNDTDATVNNMMQVLIMLLKCVLIILLIVHISGLTFTDMNHSMIQVLRIKDDLHGDMKNAYCTF